MWRNPRPPDLTPRATAGEGRHRQRGREQSALEAQIVLRTLGTGLADFRGARLQTPLSRKSGRRPDISLKEADAKLQQLRKALAAAREWIIENTRCEAGSAADDVIYEHGWWDADDRLMKQIDEALKP
jgi:hypothetical protein